jgi:hypothetical protein
VKRQISAPKKQLDTALCAFCGLLRPQAYDLPKFTLGQTPGLGI